MKFLIGCDPELFVTQQDSMGYMSDFVSAHNLIPGSKMEPHEVPFGAIQRDGVAAEFNIQPASSREEFLHNVQSVMQTLREYIGDQYELVAVPTATFDREYFESLPDIPKELGCTPDYSAYTGSQNIPPHTTETFRTGAGHIHLGWDEFLDPDDPKHFELCRQVTKQLDAALFFPSLLWDNDEKRRELYGKIGAFRPKTYGVEHRPLSNAWLNDPELILWVYDATRKAADLFFNEDYKLFEDNLCGEMIALYSAHEIDADDLNHYVQYLHTFYGFPPFPERYLK